MPQAGQGACETLRPSFPPKNPSQLVRVTRRGNRLPSFFFIFFLFAFFWPKIPPKAFPMASPGIPKSIQFCFFLNKSVSQEPSFCQLLLPTHFSLFFLSILATFLIKNQCFVCPVFGDVCAFFSTCRPLRKYAKTNTKHTFSYFALFVCFDKKSQKNIQIFSEFVPF